MTTAAFPLPNRTANRGHRALPVAWSFRNWSLRAKLILAFLAVSLIPLGLLAYMDGRSTQAVVTQNANQTLFAAASQTAASLDNFITVNLNAVRTEARLSLWQKYLLLPADQRAGSDIETDVVNTLRALSRKGQVFASAYIPSYALLDGQGRSLQDTLVSDMSRDYSGENYFQAPLQTGQVYLSPIEFSPTTGEAYLYFSSPVKDAAGQFLGVLQVSYSAAVLQQLVLQNNGLPGEKSFGLLLDENQLYLAHGTTPELLYKTVVPLDPSRISELQAARRLPNLPIDQLSTNLRDLESGLATVDTKQPFFSAELDFSDDTLGLGDKTPEQSAVAPMKTQPWVVVFAQSQDVFLAPVQAQTRSTVILSLIIGVAIIAAALGMAQVVAGPIVRLNAIAEKVASGDLSVQAKVETGDETGTLATTFNDMIFQLRGLIGTLEQRVTARTAELSKASASLGHRVNQLQAGAEVSRAATTLTNPEQLIPRVVELIQQRFDFYYVGLFLVTEGADNRYAVFQHGVGTGSAHEAGRVMKERGHRLELGGQSMVGWACANKRARIALDVGALNAAPEATRFANPLLPDTRSEIALPLLVGERVLGALDIQSMQEAAFDESDIAALQGMADQIAIALENARLFQQTQATLEQFEAANRLLMRQGWQGHLERPSTTRHSEFGAAPASAIRGAPNAVRPRRGTPNAADLLQIPLELRGQRLGQLKLRRESERPWTDEEKTIIQAVALQTMLAADNARLVEQTQTALQETEGLFDASRSIAGLGQIQEICQSLASYVNVLEQADRTIVTLLDSAVPSADNRRILARVGAGNLEGELDITFDEFNAGLGGQVARSGEPILSLSADDGLAPGASHGESEETRQRRKRHDIGALFIVPLGAKGQVIGTVSVVNRTHQRKFNQRNIDLAAALAGPAATALENVRLLEATQRRAEREQQIRQITNAIMSASNTEEALAAATDELEKLWNAALARIWLIGRDEHGEALFLRASAGLSRRLDGTRRRVPLNEAYKIGRIAISGEPKFSTQLETDPEVVDHEWVRREGLRSFVGYPLKYGGRVVGVLGMYSRELYSQAEFALMGTLAQQMSTVLENRRLFDDAQRRAERERLIRQITTRIRSAGDTQGILETTASELAHSLGVPRAIVRLTMDGLGTPLEGVLRASASANRGTR